MTDVGRIREHNEDNFLIAELTAGTRGIAAEGTTWTLGDAGAVFAVCDGMGGALAGEIASKMAVDVVHTIVSEGARPAGREQFAHRLVTAVQEAGARIYLAAKSNRMQRGMGTTSTVAGIHGTTLFVGQVGDSRAYLYRGGRLRQITKDQSLVSKLIEAGQLTEEEAESYEHSHIILQALGTADSVSVDLSYVDLRLGDTVLLCSDGLSGLLSNEQLRETLGTVDDPATCCQKLTEQANDAGGHDNITVVVAHIDGGVPSPAPDETAPGYQPFVLSEPVEALVAGRASTTMKVPDLPPPGVDFKRAHLGPPDEDEDFEVPESLPFKPDAPSEERPPSPPIQHGDWVGWALVAVGLGLLALASYLSWNANSSAEEPPQSPRVGLVAPPPTPRG
jgi:protein phosphatase